MGESFHCYRKVFPPFVPLLVLLITCSTSWQVQKGQAVNILVSYDDFVLPGNHYLNTSDYYLLMQADCDLVLYEDTKSVLSSNTSGRGKDCSLRLQADGNLIISNSTTSSNPAPFWESRTSSTPGYYYFFVLMSNGSLTIYDFVTLTATLAPVSAAPGFGNLDNFSYSRHLAWTPPSPLDGFPYMPVGYYLDEGYSLKSLRKAYNLTLAYDCNLQSLELLQNGSTRTVWETKTMSFGPGHQCRLSLQEDGNLQLLTVGSDRLVWASNVTGNSTVNWALVVDYVKGDVIVRDLLDPGNVLWNSANFPVGTDGYHGGKKISSTGLLIGVSAAVFLLTMAAVSLIYYFSASMTFFSTPNSSFNQCFNQFFLIRF